MQPRSTRWWLLPVFIVCLVLLSCEQSAPTVPAPWSVSGRWTPNPSSTPGVAYLPIARRGSDSSIYTPTPDPPHFVPTVRAEEQAYSVKSGDTLGQIAQRYGVSLEALIAANKLVNPNLLEVGQELIIPALDPSSTGPSFKIIPDSELVNSPAVIQFDIETFINDKGGYLSRYQQEVEEEGNTLSGVQIVSLVARQYSVNPRLLLAVLEYQSGWVTKSNPVADTRDYPIGIREAFRKGLYRQLAWAADNLNRGYYLWTVNGVSAWVLADGAVIPVNTTINAGTAGIQQLFALLDDRSSWQIAVSETGLFSTYENFFGYPFDYAVEPLVPAGILQPKMQLPFEKGVPWAFTGGPHGGWGDGSAWAALDFAPPVEMLGCGQSDLWVVAVANGLVVRSRNGEVVEDLDGDGYEQTGWTILYMHIESRDRVAEGTLLKAGEHIGHPSCEGGYSTATHTHLARRYNGVWIPADQTLPFALDGWASRGTGIVYDGYLERNGKSVVAWDGVIQTNIIQR
jgi:LasA protease